LRCELISNCIFTWAITRGIEYLPRYYLLWIDFKLYFYVSNHKNGKRSKNCRAVVNWFQIVFLREQSQVLYDRHKNSRCCELISNCIFTWAITRVFEALKKEAVLWIDFKLYFYVSNHKYHILITQEEALWIDFKLYFYVSNHKPM